MFNIIKRNTNIVEVLEEEMKVPFKKIGDNTYEPEDHQCPLCGHKDCFRVNTGVEDPYYKCFSCNEFGDVITFISKSRKLSMRDSALAIAKEKKIQLPNDYSPIQDIFNLSALYYQTCLKESCNKPYAELNKRTPLEYQLEVRRHKQETVDYFCIGWSDGGLVTYLRGLGFEDELLVQTGLVNKKGKDFLPTNCFIYPHRVMGRVSHFTFKDPLKKNEYQLKKASKLNNHIFYNSDSLKDQDTIIVVEGENDLLSIWESGWRQGLIATIGQLSTEQLEWLQVNLAGKKLITIFDVDDAGNKYREKVGYLKPKFSSLTQVKLSTGVKDIDEYLVNGGDLNAAITNSAVVDTIAEVSADFETEGGATGTTSTNIIEKNNCYFRVRFKDGLPVTTKLTNFIVNLRNIFIIGQEKQREVVFFREDGQQSKPTLVTSECKVSLKAFKTLAADAVDGSFYGQDNDLIPMWEHIYSRGTERFVYLPLMVGRLKEFKGWLFRDSFINDDGNVIKPDDDGIIWIDNHTTGIKSVSLNIQNIGTVKTESLDIPRLVSAYDEEEREDFIKKLIFNMVKNLGNKGLVYSILGWAKANVYSDMIFERIEGFPFLYLWGGHGVGKTYLCKWITAMFDMADCGFSTAPQYKSGVGFTRKLGYYASLPVVMDEMRAEKEIEDHYGDFRSWYQRTGRSLGTKEGFGIRSTDIRSNIIFAGQDHFTDSATRERCISLRVPTYEEGREKNHSFKWLELHRHEFSQIAYHWILESTKILKTDIDKNFDKYDLLLAEFGNPRIAKIWAAISLFADEMAKKYDPGFDYLSYVRPTVQQVIKEEKDDNNDLVGQFFGVVEGLQVADNSKISGEHLKKDKNELYVWFEDLFRIVEDSRRSGNHFSKAAIRSAIKEEKYFKGEDRKSMGMNANSRRRVIVFDLDKAPDSIKNIGFNCA